MECAMRLFTLLFAISLLISGTSMAQPQPIVTNQQINFWDAVIAGDVSSAVALIKTGADVNGLDTRPVAGPNGRRPLNYAAIRNDTAMITALLMNGQISIWLIVPVLHRCTMQLRLVLQRLRLY
jgi:hypothetical protein